MSKPIPADANVISNPYVIRGGVMINSNQPKIAIFAVAMAILGSASASCQPGKNGLRTGKCNQCYGSDRSLDNYEIR